MVLTIVGLGLGDPEDVSLKGHRAIGEADVAYLEIYTSLLIDADRAQLEQFYGREIREADRICVEERNDAILAEARTKKVALLVGGDPFSATTHAELYHKALASGVEVRVVHNASILNAVGAIGLQLYRFGEVVSIPFFERSWRPSSFLDKILQNYRANLHTLCLLDIKVRERTDENILADRLVFEPPRYALGDLRFMTVNVAIEQLMALEAPPGAPDVAELAGFGVARLGSRTQLVRAGRLRELRRLDFGPPLHSLVICAPKLHEIEQSFFNMVSV